MFKKIIFIYSIAIFAFLITSCSNTTDNTTSNHYKELSTNTVVPSDCYFICDHKGEKGVMLYTPNGENNMQFHNSRIEHIMCVDGTLIHPNGTFMLMDGKIPENCFIFISNLETNAIGVWDVAQSTWAIEPQGQFMSYHHNYGRMIDFTINGATYGIDCHPFKHNDDLYLYVNNDLDLFNCEYDGINYISNQDKTFMLNHETFYKKNMHLLIGSPYEILLKEVIKNKYLLIDYSYHTLRNDDTYVGSTSSYLCDLEGNILFPEWEYEYALYPVNQWGNIDRDLISFTNYHTNANYYYHLKSETAIAPNATFDTITAKTNTLFLLTDDNRHTIYDCSKNKLGETFTSVASSDNIKVFGTDSYIITGFKKDILVIDGVEYKQDISNYSLSAKGSVYPIVNVVDSSGNISKSYILDDKGHLFMESNHYVTYADEKYFCVYDPSNSISTVNIYAY